MKEIRRLADSIVSLQQEAKTQTLLLYKPKVEHIINFQVTDKNEIESVLDALLDVAFDDEVLLLYKKMCRYYWEINPQATAFYIQSYREMWDE